MIVLGGRTNTVNENVLMEIYETENSEWKKFNSIQRFRLLEIKLLDLSVLALIIFLFLEYCLL